jgi:hypothetical protein
MKTLISGIAVTAFGVLAVIVAVTLLMSVSP